MLAVRGARGSTSSMNAWPDARWPDMVRRDVIRHLESTYPLEGCGVILRKGMEETFRVCPLRNASARPETAYAFAPEDWLALNLQADAWGEQIVCVFHSHVDAPATFSGEDRTSAAPGGLPLLPGISYIIASVRRGCVSWVSEYAWSCGDFQTRRV